MYNDPLLFHINLLREIDKPTQPRCHSRCANTYDDVILLDVLPANNGSWVSHRLIGLYRLPPSSVVALITSRYVAVPHLV